MKAWPIPTTVLALALLAGAVDAQGTYPFGSVVGRGDYDYTPMAVALPAAALCWLDDNSNGAYTTGEALYLEVDSAACTTSEANDVRLNGNEASAAGSVLRTTDHDAGQALAGPLAHWVRWNDLDGNSEFGSRDGAYLDLMGLAALTVDVGDLRLNKVGDFPAGSIVRAGDADATNQLREFGAGRALDDANAVYVAGGGATFKAGRTLYFNADGGVVGTADLAVEANDLRLAGGGTQPFGAKPDVRGANLTLQPAEVVAGAPFRLAFEVRNHGFGAGSALLVTSLDGAPADARASPWLDPGAKATLTLTLPAPERPGLLRVDVAGLNATLTVRAPPPPPAAPAPPAPLAPSTSDAELRGLDARVRGTEAEIAVAKQRLEAAEEAIVLLRGGSGATLSASSLAAEGAERDLGPRAVPGPLAALAVLAIAGAAQLLRRARP